MQKFVMPFDNTCSECGKQIKAGQDVYAENFDEVRSGVGVCSKHVEAEAQKAKAQVGDLPVISPLDVEKEKQAKRSK